jgi:UDP-N-acetyl-2-amino-2-deoxyglucuronate dehydrogenase
MTLAGPDGKLGIAVVGAGFIADYHLAGLAAVPEADVRAIVSRTAASAEALAARFGIATGGHGPGGGARPPRYRGRDRHHAGRHPRGDRDRGARGRKGRAAAKADGDGCRSLPAAARGGPAAWHRSAGELDAPPLPRGRAARQLLAEGAIGRVTSARLRNATPGPDWADWFFARDRVGGGVVLQLGSHGIDLVEYLLGRVSSLSAWTATLEAERRLADGRVVAVENADSAWATYRLATGVVVAHEMSMIEVAGCDRFRLELYGSEGTMWLRSERGPLALFRQGTAGWEVPDLDPTPVGQRQHRHWIASLLGRAEAETTAVAGLRGLLVAEAIARSAASGGASVLVEGEGA